MAVESQRTDIDIEKFRKILTDERNRVSRVHHKQREQMLEEADDFANNDLSRNNNYGEFENADQAAELQDNERDELLDRNETTLIGDIDHALERMDAGLYGICEVTNVPIPVERLEALPWATTTVDALTELEERGRRV